jgi:hypothetical protein
VARESCQRYASAITIGGEKGKSVDTCDPVALEPAKIQYDVFNGVARPIRGCRPGPLAAPSGIPTVHSVCPSRGNYCADGIFRRVSATYDYTASIRMINVLLIVVGSFLLGALILATYLFFVVPGPGDRTD